MVCDGELLIQGHIHKLWVLSRSAFAGDLSIVPGLHCHFFMSIFSPEDREGCVQLDFKENSKKASFKSPNSM